MQLEANLGERDEERLQLGVSTFVDTPLDCLRKDLPERLPGSPNDLRTQERADSYGAPAFTARRQHSTEKLPILRVRKWKGQGLAEIHPAQFGVLGTLELRLASPPADHEHVIPRISVVGRAWPLENGHLLEDRRGDAHFLLKLANERLGWSLASSAVSAGDIPDTWIEHSIVRAPGQEDPAVPDQKTARTDSHAPRPRVITVQCSEDGQRRRMALATSAILPSG